LSQAMENPFFTDFDQVTSYMDSFTNKENRSYSKARRTYRLDRMSALLDHFGNPQKSYKTIHIAGSKGKGSTASFIASGLKASGYLTGLYMSPHVVDYRERFTLAGEFFPDEFLLETANELEKGLEGFSFCETYGENVPTTFELYTLYAFMLFAKAGCQWAVIETGLGGRLDATNVIMPEASVLTPIELEHTEILGDTITLIATEKSKIIKPGVPAFVSKQLPDARAVFAAEAKAQNSPVLFLEDELLCEDTFLPDTDEGPLERENVHLKYKDGFEASLSLRMLGKVQADNCALAILVLNTLGLLNGKKALSAMENNTLPGRMQREFFRRPIFLDGAHTPRSIESLLSTFRTVYSGKKGVCIFCCVSGKDYNTLTSMVLDAFDTIIVSKPGTFKKSDPQLIFDAFKAKASALYPASSKTIILEQDSVKALETALDFCEEGQAILVTGSFYMAGVIKEALCRLTGEKSN
jgi:dihydrofolate synthase/folylpolyglutamate synthase